jgi:hypothetical protein
MAVSRLMITEDYPEQSERSLRQAKCRQAFAARE